MFCQHTFLLFIMMLVSLLLLCRPIYTKVKENHEEIIIKKEDSRGGAGELFNKKGEIEKDKRNTRKKEGREEGGTGARGRRNRSGYRLIKIFKKEYSLPQSLSRIYVQNQKKREGEEMAVNAENELPLMQKITKSPLLLSSVVVLLSRL